MIKNNKGFTLVELIVVIAITGLIVTMVFTLVGSGRNHFRNINENFNHQSEARIAMAYITTILRQNDSTNSNITINQTEMNIVTGTGNIRIFYDGTVLREQRSTEPLPRDIARIDGIVLERNQNNISIRIDYGNGQHLDSMISLRSDGI